MPAQKGVWFANLGVGLNSHESRVKLILPAVNMAAEVERLIASDVWTPEEQVQELKRRFELSTPPQSHKLSFQPRPDDVTVAVPAKCGTTWLLHICHQLRMQGAEPDFDDQFDVITWIENTKFFYNLDPDEHAKKQPTGIRIFKSHLPYPAVPKGGKMIYCFRDQSDALYSAYKFVNSVALLKGRVSLSVFANAAVTVNHVAEESMKDLLTWWEHRHDADVLFFFFDDLREDHAGSVRRIAKFIGVECSDEVIAHVIHTTSHAEMAKHSSRFDAHKIIEFIAKKIGEKPETGDDAVGCVRKDGGKSGEGKSLPANVLEHIEQNWQDIVTAKLGFRNLKEMRDAWRNELN